MGSRNVFLKEYWNADIYYPLRQYFEVLVIIAVIGGNVSDVEL